METASQWDTSAIKRTTFGLEELLRYMVCADMELVQGPMPMKRRSLLQYSYHCHMCKYLLHGASADSEVPSVCPLGDECDACHTELEYRYHVQNYKREACSCAAHYAMYPPSLQRELCDAASVTVTKPPCECAEELQRCPFYHSSAERDAWAAYRSSSIGVDLANVEPAAIAGMFAAQRKHPFYQKLCSIVAQRDAHSSEVVPAEWGADDVEGHMRTIAANSALELNPVTVAYLVAASSTHEAVCFLTLADTCGLRVRFPQSSTSPRIVVLERGTTTEPLTLDLRLSPHDQKTIADWLLRHHEPTTNGSALNSNGNDNYRIVFPSFAACPKSPFSNENPHFYLQHLAFLVAWMKCPAAAAAFVQRKLASGVLSQREPLGTAVIDDAPLVLRSTHDVAFLLAVAHWTVEHGFCSRKGVERVAVETFLSAL